MKFKGIGVILFVRLLAIIGIVLAGIPLIEADTHPFPWVSAGALLTAVVVYLGTYTADYLSWRGFIGGGHPHDIHLFRDFLNVLRVGPTDQFFGSFDFGGTFRGDEISGLNEFVEHWNRSDREFQDRRLERARHSLYKKAETLAYALAHGTRIADSNLRTVKLDVSGPQPDSVREDARAINSAARPFAEDYKKFVRLGHKRLVLR